MATGTASAFSTVADALDGDASALDHVFTEISAGRGPARRSWPALALAASTLAESAVAESAVADRGTAPDVPEPVQVELRRAAGRYLVLTARLDEAGAALDAVGVAWAPIKGMDVASRAGTYATPEARPTADLDLLVHSRSLDPARDALQKAGWTSLVDGPNVERYLREEGYAWQARGPDGGLLELHHRLWGSVGAEVGDAMLDAAEPEGHAGSGRRRLRAEHAYLLAAVHAFLDAPPRPAFAFRDLVQLSRAGTNSTAIVEAADAFDLQLPVALAAKISHRLWGHPTDAAAVDGLQPKLRTTERTLLDAREDPEAITQPGLVAARHLARRRMRHSFHRMLVRRLWAHPGVVEATGLSRWAYQLAIFGLRPVAKATWRPQ
ncbi:MAG: nucleotidyltransferase family protein [Acidobacteriota bacterium]